MNKVAPEQLQLNTLIQKGVTFHQKGKLNEAQLIFEQALGIQANHFELLQLTGTIAVQTKCYERAIELFLRQFHCPQRMETHTTTSGSPTKRSSNLILPSAVMTKRLALILTLLRHTSTAV